MFRLALLFVLIWSLSIISCTQPTSPERGNSNTYPTPFERDTDRNTTATHDEAIDFYERLAKDFREVELQEHGLTDSGRPLHLVILSGDGDFDPTSIRRKGKRILMINNGIHPGEPVGVDASMMLVRDYLMQAELRQRLDSVVLVLIPIYNVGGSLNRGSYSRANQNGPKSYGFRGNAQNLDLNRDFIKCDSRNAEGFSRIFQHWQPDVFIDNHTTNGADYPYVMTMIGSQADKLSPPLGDYMRHQLLPNIYTAMEKAGWATSPYVFARGTPDTGIGAFLDTPRYSSGYAALFNTLSFIAEAHMLKPYEQRVGADYAFMDYMVGLLHSEEGARIAALRAAANKHVKAQQQFDLNWALDVERPDSLLFKGYEAQYKPSEVSGQNRLYYDREAMYEKFIPHFQYYRSTLNVQKPKAYIVPQSWHRVIDRLIWNGVEVSRLARDTSLTVEVYYIRNFDTGQSPYEGHYLHTNVQVERDTQSIRFYQGDYIIQTNQVRNRYIVETLEPQASDSYFCWNFFDAILQQKEYFSSYVFEDEAAKFLAEQPELKAALDKAKAENPALANNPRGQLDFIYKRSPYYEKTHQRYPVARMFD